MASRAFRGEHRRTLRLEVCFVAGLREIGAAQRFEVEVIDLSMTGFRFGTAFPLTAGQRLFVTIPGIHTLESVVAWARDGIYGAQFDRPLHAAVFDHIAAKHRHLNDDR